jgi:hypothetical protein
VVIGPAHRHAQGITVKPFGHSRERGGRRGIDGRRPECTKSDGSVGPGWWMASDGRWYRPEQHPDFVPSPTLSDASLGPGWWMASDGQWYRPEQHPDYVPPAVAPGVAPASTTEAAASVPAAAVEKVRRLGRMLDAGRLSDYEFQQMRKEILGL